MYPSPNLHAYDQPIVSKDMINQENATHSAGNDIFFLSTAYSRWEDASEFCNANDASLLEISINDSIIR